MTHPITSLCRQMHCITRMAPLLALLVSPPLIYAQPQVRKAELQPIYFAQDWCPLTDELGALEQHYSLTMSDCCIFKAERKTSDSRAAERAIAPFRDHVVAEQDLGRCVNENAETRAARMLDAKRQESERLEQAMAERKELPKRLRAVELPSLCRSAGELLRGEGSLDEAPALRDKALPFVQAELRRRGVTIEASRARAEKIRLGDSECHLYAAWGLPNHSNRTVNMNGVSVQHVFGSRTYVYTQNGRITSWQD